MTFLPGLAIGLLLGSAITTVALSVLNRRPLPEPEQPITIYPPLTPRPDPRPLAWTGYERN